MTQDFEIHGKNFKLSKIDAIKQFHIVRRIAPILSEILSGKGKKKPFKHTEKPTEKEQLEMIAQFAAPIMMGLSKLSDEDAEFVLYGLLEAVELKQPQGNWAKVSRDGNLMVQNLGLSELLNLAGRAFFYNLENFSDALPQ